MQTARPGRNLVRAHLVAPRRRIEPFLNGLRELRDGRRLDAILARDLDDLRALRGDELGRNHRAELAESRERRGIVVSVVEGILQDGPQQFLGARAHGRQPRAVRRCRAQCLDLVALRADLFDLHAWLRQQRELLLEGRDPLRA